jgi:hypothetical protein
MKNYKQMLVWVEEEKLQELKLKALTERKTLSFLIREFINKILKKDNS